VPTRVPRVRVGTSGWEYPHWRGRFYPRDLSKDRWLEHYVEHFDTLELNNSFYRLPEADTFTAWRRRLPTGFTMAVKASRYLTHLKRLRDPEEPLERFWSRARRLADHLGPVLYQLPPRWHRNPERLGAFLDVVPKRRPQAIEFRDPSWYHPETDSLLRRARVGICLHDMAGSAYAGPPVGPIAYLRFHGSTARYQGSYSSQRLAAVAERLTGWAHDGLACWVYFNNDPEAHAVRDAMRLRDYLARRNVA
jgi:uncharacterized protein YecE (DUF72 family)